MSFKKHQHEYINTIPLAGLLVLSITILLGSLFALNIGGMLFGFIALVFPILSGDVVKLVFNNQMAKMNVIFITVGSLCLFSSLLFSEAFFLPYIISLIIWVLYFFKNLEEITKDEQAAENI